MIKTEFADKSEIVIPETEVLRYLGYPADTDEKIPPIIGECTDELHESLACKACLSHFEISVYGGCFTDFGFMNVKSCALAKNLDGCDEAIVFAATIGFGIDRLIQRYSAVAPSRAAVLQAVGTAAAEAWCDLLCKRLRKYYSQKGVHPRSRFSPGYGDFLIDHQKDILHRLNAHARAGISLTDSLMMLPSKSVSAVVGLSRTERECDFGCEACKNTECIFRRVK